MATLSASPTRVTLAPIDLLPAAGLVVTAAGGAAANGGYFASSWGWLSLALLWIAALGATRLKRLSVFEHLALISLTGFAVLTWISAGWSLESTASLREGQRVLVGLAGFLAALVSVRRATVIHFVTGLVLACSAICVYALATRLFPAHISSDVIAGYRLTRPLGYWNALGIFGAIAFALAVGLVARGPRVSRVIGAACVPVLGTSVYFTYSRGAVVALAIGLIVTFALDPQRVQWVVGLVPLAVSAGVAVIVASRLSALTTVGSTVSRAAYEGHALAALIALLALATAALVYWRAAPSAGGDVGRLVTLVVSAAIIVVFVVGVVAEGGPSGLRDKFTAPPPVTHGQLNKRLFSFSGSYRAPLWNIAWQEYESHPLLGGGAGSYETYYLQHRTRPDKVKNAHNLYLETVAEVGPVGLLLLLVALLTPLYAALKARRHPLVPALAGAYVAFLVHMAVDWDWQVTAVALTGLFCGAAILVAARSGDYEENELSPRVRYSLLGAMLVVMGIAFIGLVGNMSLAQASSAADNGNWAASARDARRAHTWAPWSSEPYRLLGEAQLGEGDTKSAIASFNKAIAKSPDDWNLWFDLARATTGRPQRVALDHAARLNPLAPEIAELRKEIAAQPVLDVTKK